MSTEPQSHETTLRVNVRQRIEHGRLPGVRPREIAAGYGSGHICVVCDKPVSSKQVEYEVEDAGTGKRLHFHSECHSLWQSECTQRVSQQ
jgi:hypothetical protein